MNSEEVSYEELVVTGQNKVDAKGKSTSKVVLDNKKSLKKQSTEHIQENRKRTLYFSEAFSPERSLSKSENLKDYFHEESKNDQKKAKASPLESDDTVIDKDKANAKDKDFSDKEYKSEENFKEEESKEEKIIESSAQVGECYYLQLKPGDRFEFQESSYNFDTRNLYFGSKVRLAIGVRLVDSIRNDYIFDVMPEDTNIFDYDEVKIVDAVILLPLDNILAFWFVERDIFEEIFGEELS
jgi:hypothetical protein